MKKTLYLFEGLNCLCSSFLSSKKPKMKPMTLNRIAMPLTNNHKIGPKGWLYHCFGKYPPNRHITVPRPSMSAKTPTISHCVDFFKGYHCSLDYGGAQKSIMNFKYCFEAKSYRHQLQKT